MGRRLQINGEEVEAPEDAKLKDVLAQDDVPGSPEGQATIDRGGEMFAVDKHEPVTNIPEGENISVNLAQDRMLG